MISSNRWTALTIQSTAETSSIRQGGSRPIYVYIIYYIYVEEKKRREGDTGVGDQGGIPWSICHTSDGCVQDGEQQVAEDRKKYERNERYDRVQAIYYLFLIGRDASRRCPPVLGECVTADHHMYRVLLCRMVRCYIRGQTISDLMIPLLSWHVLWLV